MRDVLKKGEVLFFLTYAFTIPLVCICLMAYVPACNQGIVQFVLFGIQAASPTIAALLVVLQRQGAGGLRNFLRDRYAAFSLKWCVIGLLTPVALLTVGKLITYLTPYNNPFITELSPQKLVVVAWALVAEELGWRGYLQDKIAERFGETITPLIVGAIWSAWHYHFFISGTLAVPLAVFIFSCVAESYGYYVITRLAKGNILPASLWHFSGNLFLNLYLLNPEQNNGSAIPYIIANLLSVVYIIAFICYRKFQQKEGI